MLINNALFINCNYVLNDNAEHLDIVIPMCNLIEYSKNYLIPYIWYCIELYKRHFS